MCGFKYEYVYIFIYMNVNISKLPKFSNFTVFFIKERVESKIGSCAFDVYQISTWVFKRDNIGLEIFDCIKYSFHPLLCWGGLRGPHHHDYLHGGWVVAEPPPPRPPPHVFVPRKRGSGPWGLCQGGGGSSMTRSLLC